MYKRQDIDPTHKGFEVWGSTATIPANISGENIADTWNGFKFRKIDGTVDSDATIPVSYTHLCKYGGVAEWLKTQHWKCCNGLRRSWVRIPSLPPIIKSLKPKGFKLFFFIKLRNMLGNRRQQGL